MDFVSVRWGDELLASGWVDPEVGVRGELRPYLEQSLEPRFAGLAVTRTPGIPPARATRRRPIERRVVAAQLASLLAFSAIFAASAFAVPDGRSLSLASLRAPTLEAVYTVEPPQEPLVPRYARLTMAEGEIPDREGQPMKVESGLAGARDNPRTRAGRIRVPGEDERALIPRAEPDPRSMGVLGALALQPEIPREGAMAGALAASGWSRDAAYGRPMAAVEGFGHGASGFDMVGLGRGGCRAGSPNCAAGTVGIGRRGLAGGFGATCDAECVAAMLGHGSGHGVLGLRSAARNERTRPGHDTTVPQLRSTERSAPSGLTPDQVRRVVRRHLDEVRHCYRQSQRLEEGPVEVRLVIQPTGAVGATTVVRSALPEGVSGCVASAARRWSFPAAQGPTVVDYPFHIAEL